VEDKAIFLKDQKIVGMQETLKFYIFNKRKLKLTIVRRINAFDPNEDEFN